MTETYLQKLQREHKERRARLSPPPKPDNKVCQKPEEGTPEELEAIVTRSELSFKTIFKEVCKYYGVSMLDVISPRRNMKIVMARHIVAYIALQHTKLSTGQVASLLARDHSTIVYARQRMETLMENETVKSVVLEIKRRLGL